MTNQPQGMRTRPNGTNGNIRAVNADDDMENSTQYYETDQDYTENQDNDKFCEGFDQSQNFIDTDSGN